MAKPINYLKDMHPNQKEFLFRKVLEAMLAFENYFLSRPEPDIGHDMMLLDKQQLYVCHAQCKSMFTASPVKGGKRYLTNIKGRRLLASLERKYIYFIGLYEPDYKPLQFHIACIPSSFFVTYWDLLMKKKPQKDGRLPIEIDYYIDEGRYFMFPKQQVEVTEYFNNFDAIN
jgi:hypothetical protein